jgi:orotidine-5'-phosphate decarboxylase
VISRFPSQAPLILALDVSSKEEALRWVRLLRNDISVFKVGMQLFYQEGPQIVRRIQDEGGEVFLDLKLHDIPNTVGHACMSLASLNAMFLTIHTSGGLAMMEAAQAAMQDSNTKLLGITALTSLDQETLKAVYPDLRQSPAEWALHLAKLANQAGLYGVVCSAQENPTMRKHLGTSFCLVNPGIRPEGAAVQDQKRIVTPKEAMQSGANYLVVGRPILKAPDPQAMVAELLQEIGHAIGLSS